MFLKCDIPKDSLLDYSMYSLLVFVLFLPKTGYFSCSTYFKVKNRRCMVSELAERFSQPS